MKRVFFAFLISALFLVGSHPLSLADPIPGPHDFAFPKDFKWCVATAAYQVEGDDINSDWWSWEHQPGRVALDAQGKPQYSGKADDHWNRLEEDTQLLKDLHVNTYRFSIEWAKIEPKEGVIDQAAIAHYKKEIALLHAAGIEPMITLWHYTLPQWVADKGGFEWEGLPDAFAEYSTLVYNAIAPDVRDFLTLNEPVVYIAAAYLGGIYPPGYSNLHAIFAPLVVMLSAHAKAYHALHHAADALGKKIRVGTANHLRIFDPFDPLKNLDRSWAQKLDAAFNWAFPDALQTGTINMTLFPYAVNKQIDGLANTQDFLGVNYYSRTLVKFSLGNNFVQMIDNPDGPKTDLGWEIYPEGLYTVLKTSAKRYPNLPILITENGIADAADKLRPQFILDHLKQMKRAMEEGVPVETYCHWSIMDNFEWANGYNARFGLYSVDYATQKRTPRTSAKIFSRIAGENRIFNTVQDALGLPQTAPDAASSVQPTHLQ